MSRASDRANTKSLWRQRKRKQYSIAAVRNYLAGHKTRRREST